MIFAGLRLRKCKRCHFGLRIGLYVGVRSGLGVCLYAVVGLNLIVYPCLVVCLLIGSRNMRFKRANYSLLHCWSGNSIESYLVFAYRSLWLHDDISDTFDVISTESYNWSKNI